MASRVVFLDACVLYGPVPRTVLMRAAEAGLLAPRWSPRVLAEWRIAAARNGGLEAEDRVADAIAEIEARFPAARVEPAPGAEHDHPLPDPADAHVLAAAAVAGAELILTFNIRDFPTRRLAAQGLVARHPDGFLWELLGEAPEIIDAAIREATAGAGTPRRALKRAQLPRLAKAWSAGAGSPPAG